MLYKANLSLHVNEWPWLVAFRRESLCPLFCFLVPGSRKAVFHPLPAALGHLRRMALLSPQSSLSSLTHLQVYPFLLCLSQVSFSLCCWPPMDTGACLLFTVWCIVTPFDLLLFEPDAVCLVAFNPLKGWRMQFMWMMALYKKAKSYCTSCLSWADFPVSTPTLTKRLMNQEVHLGGFKLPVSWEMPVHSSDH